MAAEDGRPFSQYCSGLLSTDVEDEHVCKRGNVVFKPTFVGKAG